MPIALRAAAADNLAVGATDSVTVVKPSGVLDGDFLVAAITVDGGTGTTITPPGGWTLLRRVDIGTNIGLAVYWKWAEGEPTRWEFTLGATVQAAGGVTAYVGVDSFDPLEDFDAEVTDTAGSHDTPRLEVSVGCTDLVALAAAATGTYTAPSSAFYQRFAKAQANAVVTLFDHAAAAGEVAATGAGFSAVTQGISIRLALRPSPTELTGDDVKRLLVGLMPPGRLYDYWSDASLVGDLFAALGDAVLRYGFKYVDRLRREIVPGLPGQVQKLVDWERVFRLPSAGSKLDRQARILARWRESGATTLDNVRAILGPQLGYVDPSALEIIETPRASLRTAHEYVNSSGGVVAPLGNLAQTVTVLDQALVSQAGAQLKIVLSATDLSDLGLTLTSPGATQKVWAPFSAETVAGATRYAYAIEMAGATCGGTWTLNFANGDPVNAITITSWTLFVEGIGRDGTKEGLGRSIFDWCILVDPTLAGGNGTIPDYAAARRTLDRIKQAHTRADLALKSLNGDDAGVWGDPTNSVWDGFVWE